MPTLVLSESLGSFSFCLLNILNWTMRLRLMQKNYSSCLCSWRNSFTISYLLSDFACRIGSSDISVVCPQILPSSIWSPSLPLPPFFLPPPWAGPLSMLLLSSSSTQSFHWSFSFLISRFDLVFSKSWSDYLSFHRLTAHWILWRNNCPGPLPI